MIVPTYSVTEQSLHVVKSSNKQDIESNHQQGAVNKCVCLQNKARNMPYLLAVICIYFSTFLVRCYYTSQNMTSLHRNSPTDSAGIAYLISGIGLGRLVSILFFIGVLSDKFGRRAIMLLSAVLYAVLPVFPPV